MKIHAALFQGEVGWEVSQWIPYLRHLANHHKAKRFTAECRPGFGYLYKDFAEPTERPIDVKLRPDMVYAYRGKIVRPVKSPFITDADRVVAAETLACVPDESGVPQLHAPRLHRQTPYGIELVTEPDPYTVCIHGRNISRHPDRNWKGWDELVTHISEFFGLVQWVGGPDDYYPGTTLRRSVSSVHIDFRGKPIEDQIDAMRSSKFCMGASSGTLHIAQHSGCPVLVWSGNAKDGPRWSKAWNPHRTKVRFIDAWQPSVDDVLKEIETFDP